MFFRVFQLGDCSDVDERNMTYTQVGETRDKYASTVASVIEAVQASNTYIAVAGPEILGEGPIKPQSERTLFACSNFLL